MSRLSVDDAFPILRSIARDLRRGEDAVGRDRLIRFLDGWNADDDLAPVVDSLCAKYGLFPYITAVTSSDESQALAIEAHSPKELRLPAFTFHSEQKKVYDRLLDGESVILSAPTSFGKSAILEGIVASNQWSNIVVIVPSLALIDETRRRLASYRSDYTIITHASATMGDRNILILTQERLLEMRELPPVDFFVIDEFYKLGASGDPRRQALLNQAWRKLRQTGAQFYLIGPNVDRLDDALPSDIKLALMKTDFRTVAVDVEDRSSVPEPLADVVALASQSELESTLVFCASPSKAQSLAFAISTARADGVADGWAALAADWVSQAYSPRWLGVASLRAGVAMHFGPLPRALQRVMVRLLNESALPVLVCTSTLIEGVNTAARTVVVYDHKIDGQLLDFFTFSNIRGRAGRMFRHFVGRVITYMPPPEAEETEIDIPIETQSDRASVASLAQLEWSELSPGAQGRMSGLFEQQVLPMSVIRSNVGVDPDAQIGLARRLLSSMDDVRQLGWSGYPVNATLYRTLSLAWDELAEGFERRGLNFNSVWGRLQNSRQNAGDYSAMFAQQESFLRANQTFDDAVLDVFRFQRNWLGFTLPSWLRTVERIRNEIAPRMGISGEANYSALIAQMEGLFLPPGVAELEEYGLPIPVALKLGLQGDGVESVLQDFRSKALDARVVGRLTAFEQWVVSDVREGLGGL